MRSTYKSSSTSFDIVLIITTIVMLPLGTIWQGVALSYLWDWFIVPLGVVSISIAHAIGISIVAQSFLAALARSAEIESEKKDPHERLLEAIVKAILLPLFMLVIGYIVQAFM